jgi:putative ABC transport system permease protein
VPALRASAASPVTALKTSSGRHTPRARLLRPLVTAQVAFSLGVLFPACLLLFSFARLAHVNPGFVAEGVTLITTGFVNETTGAEAREAVLSLAEQVRSLPGVTSAGTSKWALLSGAGWNGTVFVNGRSPNDTDVWFLEVSPRFIETMRIPLLAGRDLTRADFNDRRPSAVVNETFARLFLPGGLPLGRQFVRKERRREGDAEREIPYEVVGLVGDAKYNDLREPTPPTVYLPFVLRNDPTDGWGTLAIRSTTPPPTVVEAVRTAAARVTPAMKVTAVTDEATLAMNTMLRERMLALLSGFFALVSLSLAAVGLYGVLSYSVVQQTREIGIRMALGAAHRVVVRAVVWSVWTYVLAGMAVGLAAGLWLSRFVTALLYEVRPGDASSIVAPLTVLLLVAVLASLLPARRAALVDPIVALRDE